MTKARLIYLAVVASLIVFFVQSFWSGMSDGGGGR